MSTRRNQVLIRELVSSGPSVKRVERVKCLLACNFSPNVQAADGISPLMLAAEQGDTKMVALLLAEDANPNLVNVNRQTALTIAASFDSEAHRNICHQLIRAGARLDRNGDILNTRLLVACLRGDIAAVEQYLEQGADINTSILLRRYSSAPLDKRDVDLATTPLMIAVDRGYEALVEIFVSKGADIYCHIRKEIIFELIDWQMRSGTSERKDAAKVLHAVLRGAVLADDLELVIGCLVLGRKFNKADKAPLPVSDTDYRAIRKPLPDKLNDEAIIVNHFRKVKIKPLPLFNVNACNQQGLNAFDLVSQRKMSVKADDKTNEELIYEALEAAGGKLSSLSSRKSRVLSSSSSKPMAAVAEATSYRRASLAPSKPSVLVKDLASLSKSHSCSELDAYSQQQQQKQRATQKNSRRPSVEPFAATATGSSGAALKRQSKNANMRVRKEREKAVGSFSAQGVSAASSSRRKGKRKARSHGSQARAVTSLGHSQHLVVPDMSKIYQEKCPEQSNKVSLQQQNSRRFSREFVPATATGQPTAALKREPKNANIRVKEEREKAHSSSSALDASTASTSIRKGKRKACSNGHRARPEARMRHDHSASSAMGVSAAPTFSTKTRFVSSQGHCQCGVIPDINNKPKNAFQAKAASQKPYADIAVTLNHIEKKKHHKSLASESHSRKSRSQKPTREDSVLVGRARKAVLSGIPSAQMTSQLSSSKSRFFKGKKQKPKGKEKAVSTWFKRALR